MTAQIVFTHDKRYVMRISVALGTKVSLLQRISLRVRLNRNSHVRQARVVEEDVGWIIQIRLNYCDQITACREIAEIIRRTMNYPMRTAVHLPPTLINPKSHCQQGDKKLTYYGDGIWA